MSNRYKAAISYVGIYFTGILFLIIEKEDEFVRKSASQSFVLGLTAVLTHNFLLFLPLKALNNIYFKIPFISDISEKYIMHWFK